MACSEEDEMEWHSLDGRNWQRRPAWFRSMKAVTGYTSTPACQQWIIG